MNMGPDVAARSYVYNKEAETWNKDIDTHIQAHMSDTEVSTSTNYIIVDKDDTTNYPHENTTLLGLVGYRFSFDPNTNFVGSVEVGFLENVDATNGDFYPVISYKMVKNPTTITDSVIYRYPICLCSDAVATVETTDDTGWTTGTNLSSPVGNANPGDGDLVLSVNVSGGECGFSISCKYLSRKKKLNE